MYNLFSHEHIQFSKMTILQRQFGTSLKFYLQKSLFSCITWQLGRKEDLIVINWSYHLRQLIMFITIPGKPILHDKLITNMDLFHFLMVALNAIFIKTKILQNFSRFKC